MRVTELLSEANLMELFDSSADVQIHKNNNEKIEATFLVNNEKYLFYMTRTGTHSNIWHIDYAHIDEDGQPSFEPTALQGADAPKVLSTVVGLLEKAIVEKKPDMIQFEGNKGVGLARLYNSMARFMKSRVAKYGYHVQVFDDSSADGFAIVNDEWEAERIKSDGVSQ